MTLRFCLRGILLAAVLCCSGCLQIDANLEVQADGSGRLRLTYSLKKQMLEQVQAMQRLGVQLARAASTNAAPEALDIPLLFDEGRLREQFAGYTGQGVTLKGVTIRTRNEWQTAELQIAFDQLDALLRLPCFRDCPAALRKDKRGTYVLSLGGPEFPRDATFPDIQDDATVQNLTPLLGGLQSVVRVTVPGDILQTNAGNSDGRRATWEFIYDKEPKAFEPLVNPAQARMVVAFDGAGVFIREFEKPATPAAGPKK